LYGAGDSQRRKAKAQLAPSRTASRTGIKTAVRDGAGGAAIDVNQATLPCFAPELCLECQLTAIRKEQELAKAHKRNRDSVRASGLTEVVLDRRSHRLGGVSMDSDPDPDCPRSTAGIIITIAIGLALCFALAATAAAWLFRA
jgi:hypothetical protein